MPVRPLPVEIDVDAEPYLFAGGPWFRPPGTEAGSGVWAVRTRLTLDEPVRTRFRLEAIGGYELFCNGESVGRSPYDQQPTGLSRGDFEADLPAGRHEIFLYLWAWNGDRLPPAFRFASELAHDPFGTNGGSWHAARLSNVRFPLPRKGRVHILGEPTGPGGMDRGAVWKPVEVESDFISDVATLEAARMLELPSDAVENVRIAEGSGTTDEFVRCLKGDGQFSVRAVERAVVSLRLREPEFFLKLRASGGAGASITFRVGDHPGNQDVFEPRGFRQDFASFAPFEGDEATITIEGGERGAALFRLQLLREHGS